MRSCCTMPVLHVLLLVLQILTLIVGLPITSKTLDNNPDHLIWPALIADSRIINDEYENARKLVKKTIFIAPSLDNSQFLINCPIGYRVDHQGQCVQTIEINATALLANRINAIFSYNTDNNPSTDDTDYDYDNEELVEETKSPYHSNIPLPLDTNKELKPPQILQLNFSTTLPTLSSIRPTLQSLSTHKMTSIPTTPRSVKQPPPSVNHFLVPLDGLSTPNIIQYNISAKNGKDKEKKPTVWVPPGWELDTKQKSNPMLLRFWYKIPQNKNSTRTSLRSPNYTRTHREKKVLRKLSTKKYKLRTHTRCFSPGNCISRTVMVPRDKLSSASAKRTNRRRKN